MARSEAHNEGIRSFRVLHEQPMDFREQERMCAKGSDEQTRSNYL